MLARMATKGRNSSRTDRDDQEQRARPRKSQQPPIVPALLLIVLIAGAIVLARTVAQKQDAEPAPAPQPTAPKPFASVPDEAPPAPKAGSARISYPRAPDGLADSNPVWAEALKVAATAAELFDEAQKARAAEDHALFQLKGKAAKETYDKAFLMTAEWEEKLLEQYGDRDPQVREILSTRNRWIDRVRVLHKTTGR